MESRAGRETAFGRIGVYASLSEKVGAMVEVQCESAPVAGNVEFIALANDLARKLASSPQATTPEKLLAEPSPSQPGRKLQDVMDDLSNRIREVFRVSRQLRFDGSCGGYVHHTGDKGVLLEVSGGDENIAKEICMHITAIRPKVVTIADLDPADVAKEREILSEAARREGKPENIISKMVEGRLKNYYAETVLTEQPFVKDDKKTVGQVAKEAGLTLKRFAYWVVGGG
jgi:elongation factor Ts